jgi:hypothetical protein
MSSTGYWWLALGLGLVVAVVAVGLLQLLLQQVWRVERAAGEVWAAGKQVAGNTANTWVLNTARVEVDRLTDEAVAHKRFLEGSSDGGAR